MPENIRSLTTRLNKSLMNLFNAPRLRARLPLTVSLDVKRPNGLVQSSSQRQSVSGHTQDLSANDFSFVVPVIRLDEHYLAGTQQKLRVEVKLPSGVVKFLAVASQYERIEEKGAVTGYLISASIVAMEDSDRQDYENFIKNTGGSADKKTDSRAKNAKPSLLGQFFSLF